jgi:hypothetical protein
MSIRNNRNLDMKFFRKKNIVLKLIEFQIGFLDKFVTSDIKEIYLKTILKSQKWVKKIKKIIK